MNRKSADWRADLDASRDLNDRERQHYGFLVSWFENWRTRETYAGWARRYGDWVGDAQEAMDTGRGAEWLEHLVSVGKVSFATQKQALNALVFFYRDVCGIEEVRLEVRLRKTKQREPVVLTKEELLGLLDRLEGQYRLAAELQYGGGLRLNEVVGLRVKDIDPVREQITVRRHHLHPDVYGENVRRAAAGAGIAKRVTTHALSQFFPHRIEG